MTRPPSRVTCSGRDFLSVRTDPPEGFCGARRLPDGARAAPAGRERGARGGAPRLPRRGSAQYSTSMSDAAAVNWPSMAWFIMSFAMLPETLSLPVMKAIWVFNSPLEIATAVS